jgi:hypothetical protein
MSNLAEIEAAAEGLTAEQKQELLLFLAASLRSKNLQMPAPRKFTAEQIRSWIAEDEADMREFNEGK